MSFRCRHLRHLRNRFPPQHQRQPHPNILSCSASLPPSIAHSAHSVWIAFTRSCSEESLARAAAWHRQAYHVPAKAAAPFEHPPPIHIRVHRRPAFGGRAQPSLGWHRVTAVLWEDVMVTPYALGYDLPLMHLAMHPGSAVHSYSCRPDMTAGNCLICLLPSCCSRRDESQSTPPPSLLPREHMVGHNGYHHPGDSEMDVVFGRAGGREVTFTAPLPPLDQQQQAGRCEHQNYQLRPLGAVAAMGTGLTATGANFRVPMIGSTRPSAPEAA